MKPVTELYVQIKFRPVDWELFSKISYQSGFRKRWFFSVQIAMNVWAMNTTHDVPGPSDAKEKREAHAQLK